MLVGDESLSPSFQTEFKNTLPTAYQDFLSLSEFNRIEVAVFNLPQASPAAQYMQLAEHLFTTLKALLKQADPTRVQVVLLSPQYADIFPGIDALFKTATLENPKITGQLIYESSPKDLDMSSLCQRLVEESFRSEHSIIRYRNNNREVMRWSTISEDVLQSASDDVSSDALTNSALALKEQGLYLITGGLGGLGKIWTQHVLSCTQQSHIVLTGRAKLTNKNSKSIEAELKALAGAQRHRVHYRCLDVENSDHIVELITELSKEDLANNGGILNGIIHSAGQVSDNFILKKSHEEFTEVLRPKVLGAYFLDQATQHMPLDFFVLFSSMAAWLGNVGQADYATANGFMDGFAHHRQTLAMTGKRQGISVSINWPGWKTGGMHIAPEYVEVLSQKTGMSLLSEQQGLFAFEQVLQCSKALFMEAPQSDSSRSRALAQILVMYGNRDKMQAVLQAPERDLPIGKNEKLVHSPESNELSTSKAHSNIQAETLLSGNVLSEKPLSEKPLSENSNLKTNNSQGRVSRVELEKKTQQFLAQQFSTALKIPFNRIEIQAPLENYGIDSIMAMNLTTALEKTFGKLSKTLFFEYLSIQALAEYFMDEHGALLTSMLFPQSSSVDASRHSSPSTSNNTSEATDKSQTTDKQRSQKTVWRHANSGMKTQRDRQDIEQANPAEAKLKPNIKPNIKPIKSGLNPSERFPEREPIAIIGLSGRYPKSPNLEAFWQNLKQGIDCIEEVPEHRWDWRAFYQAIDQETHHSNHQADLQTLGAHKSKWGGFIEGVDEFDPRFFNISPKEAPTIDPQERLFLQHVWMALEDAGYTRERLQHVQTFTPSNSNDKETKSNGPLPGQVGVYAGVMYGEYNVSGSLASIANRVSYVLNVHGPCMTLDTMCSSSLTALHLACQDLQLGTTGLGIAGGVNVSVHPNKYSMLSQGQFISSDGHCQSFGEGGDGYIPGEGVGVAILKRLSDAERDGDAIYGVIKGSAINHGGKTNGYTVPNPQAQANVIQTALQHSGIDPQDISYIEAHGTGTKLGDPIEITALSKAFYHNQTPEEKTYGFCRIGSAKSNIGHCESAAGIAGVTKVLLQMKHQSIVPSLHSKVLNPHIDFERTPFVVNQTLMPWQPSAKNNQTVPRMAGISSFGAGGSNAHILIEEYRKAERIESDIDISALVFSARTHEQLKTKLNDFCKFIESDAAQNLSWRDIAYTLQTGREAMDERFACVLPRQIEDPTDYVRQRLTAYVENEQLDNDCFYASIKRHRETVALFKQDEDLQTTITQWLTKKRWDKLLDLWVKGLPMAWDQLYPEALPQKVHLPTYPFAKDRYWQTPFGLTHPSIPSKSSKPSNVANEFHHEFHHDSASHKNAHLHPLLHTNQSTLAMPSFKTVLTGNEPFLWRSESSDSFNVQTSFNQKSQRALPPWACLEMMFAALCTALPEATRSEGLEREGSQREGLQDVRLERVGLQSPGRESTGLQSTGVQSTGVQSAGVQKVELQHVEWGDAVIHKNVDKTLDKGVDKACDKGLEDGHSIHTIILPPATREAGNEGSLRVEKS